MSCNTRFGVELVVVWRFVLATNFITHTTPNITPQTLAHYISHLVPLCNATSWWYTERGQMADQCTYKMIVAASPAYTPLHPTIQPHIL